MNQFESVLKAHLDEMAAKDALFAAKYNNPEKSIEDCAKYVIAEVKKRLKSGNNVVSVPDAEVYGMAVHYYQEDSIGKPTETVKAKVIAPPSATKAIRKPRAKAKKAEPKSDELAFEVPLFEI